MPAAQDLRFASIDGLRAVDAAERLGSFERAADGLAISVSAVSQRLATLEDLLAMPLLLRSGKTLALTAAGKECLTQVCAALGLLAAMPLHRRPSQRLQRSRVTIRPNFAHQILVPQLASFTAAHPEIELELRLSIRYLDRAAPQGSDIELRAGDPASLAGSRPTWPTRRCCATRWRPGRPGCAPPACPGPSRPAARDWWIWA